MDRESRFLTYVTIVRFVANCLLCHVILYGLFLQPSEAASASPVPRLALAVLPMEVHGDVAGGGSVIYDGFVNGLVGSGRFEVVERRILDRVLEELKLGSSRLVDPKEAARVGRLVAADFMVAGSVYSEKKILRMTARLIDTETAEIFSAHDLATESTGLVGTQKLLTGLVAAIVSDMPSLEGLVIKVEGQTLYLDLGEKSGIRKNARVLLGRSLPSSEPGKSASGMAWYGEARVVDVSEEFSRAEPIRKTRAPLVLDGIVTK